MNTIFSTQLENDNMYTLNKDKKVVFLTHPDLVKHIYSQDDSETYYAKKAAYLKEQGYLSGFEHTYTGRISTDIVHQQILNLGQLTFEITDACNLKCKYCGYGEFYSDYDSREKNMMSLKKAYHILDYLVDEWNKNPVMSFNKLTFVSFYGGEPLLNMPFIVSVIDYIKQLKITNRNIEFSMTTNAVLLDRYMDILARHSFHVLISLDGDEYGNSYRVRQDGSSSFGRIIENVDLLKEKYPDYFERFVTFNAVLHNRNTVKGIYDFIYNRYGKTARISELNTTGIRPDKKEEFNQAYRNKDESLHQSENYEALEKTLFMQSSSYSSACLFLHRLNEGVIGTYTDFFDKPAARNFVPTGTCIPFSKKIFITVHGKILVCERIGHRFALGSVSDEKVELDIDSVVKRHNDYLDKLQFLCKRCLRAGDCIQCFYNIDTIDEKVPVCHGFSKPGNYIEELARTMIFFERHPEAYEELMTKALIF